MALKRSIAETKQFDGPNESHSLQKRARLFPAIASSDASEMSSISASQASETNSSPEAVTRGQDSSVSSAPSHATMDESDSSMEGDSVDSESSTSEEEEEEEDDDDGDPNRSEVVTLGAPKKPTIKAGAFTGASDLASRLKAFLPQMQQANNDLAKSGAGLSMEDVDDGEPHIEMSLGLGVLEQKKEEDLEDLLRKKAGSGADDDQSGSDSDDQASKDEPDVLDRLMNMEREVARAGQPSIEEVEYKPSEDEVSSTRNAPPEGRREDLTLR